MKYGRKHKLQVEKVSSKPILSAQKTITVKYTRAVKYRMS